MSVIRAVPIGIGHYLPSRIVENKEFEKSLDTSDDWIKARSGICLLYTSDAADE